MLRIAALGHAHVSDDLSTKACDSYEVMKGSITEYVHNCESYVSYFSFEDICPATRKAAAGTMRNNIKGIEACIDNWLDALSAHFQNLSCTSQKKEMETQKLL